MLSYGAGSSSEQEYCVRSAVHSHTTSLIHMYIPTNNKKMELKLGPSIADLHRWYQVQHGLRGVLQDVMAETFVVYPRLRANVHVDDIKFHSGTLVKIVVQARRTLSGC